jgi:hypothetical protein
VSYLLGHPNDEWYARLFANAQSNGLIAGEITPEYAILSEERFRHLKRINPHVRLIFIMRDPVDRTWSAITRRFNQKSSKSPLTAAMALECARLPGIVSKSTYTHTISRIEAIFPFAQLHCCFYDDLRDRPHAFLAGILSFLGVEMDRDIKLPSKMHSSANSHPMPLEFEREMARFYLPMARNLCQRFEGPPQSWLDRYERLIS